MTEPLTLAQRGYPGITRAALEIAYDNGGVNRTRSEKKMLKELGCFLDRQPSEILPLIDAWLVTLPDEDLQTVCAGDASDAAAILRAAPPFTDQLLNDYFNEVC